MLAVGSQVIDLTPTPVKEWAIAQFGTHDKTILVGSVLARRAACSPRSPACSPRAGSRTAPACCVVLVAIPALPR